jgi:5-deoxy-glucuronate isomerase
MDALFSTIPTEAFSTGDRETGLVCLSGEAGVTVDSKDIPMGRYYSIYIPRDSDVKVSTESNVDFAEFSADVAGKYLLQVVRYSDVERDPGLNFNTGGPAPFKYAARQERSSETGRGFHRLRTRQWTSWPPHEHADMLEEIYVFFNMPDPAFGIQMVYNNTAYPELVTVVRDGDAVLMPSGFHPNVSVPGQRISFLWAMAAHREVEDRQFGVVNVQRGFDQGGSRLEAGRKT